MPGVYLGHLLLGVGVPQPQLQVVGPREDPGPPGVPVQAVDAALVALEGGGQTQTRHERGMSVVTAAKGGW